MPTTDEQADRDLRGADDERRPYEPTGAELDVFRREAIANHPDEALTLALCAARGLDVTKAGPATQLLAAALRSGPAGLAAPAYSVGAQVRLARTEVGYIGTVTERYVNERGRWEYQVKLRIAGRTLTNPYIESELERA
jgi:hypothetical protein